jgi:IclR family transcriptional regulator, pca regulon regulatory protein
VSSRASAPPYTPKGGPWVPKLVGGYSQSLERGLAIIGCFTPERPLLGIADIADELGLSRSTTHRYVITLVELGMLEQPGGDGRKYRLGLRGTDLGMVTLDSLPLRACAHPILEELRRKVSYTVSIAVLEGGEIVFVDRLRGFRGHTKLGLNLGPGSRLPAYCTSMGKVLLANLPREECRETMRGLRLIKKGPNTITRKHLLWMELLQTHEAGLAVSDEELAVGVCSIASPVLSGTHGVVAAASVAAPTSMIPRSQMIEDFVPQLLAAAKNISTALALKSPAGTGQRPEE